MFDDKFPIIWIFFFLIYWAQFVGYIEVVDMPIPEDKSEDGYAEKIRQYGKLNGRLLQ